MPVSRARNLRPRAIVGALIAALLVASGATPAAAAPISMDFPTVFISQVTGQTTTLLTATQSSLGGGSMTLTPVLTTNYTYNSLGYRYADGYIYGMNNTAQLIRIEQSGTGYAVVPLGDVRNASGTSPISGQLAAGSFGEGPYLDQYFARGASGVMYRINVDTRRYTSFNLSSNVTLYDFTAAHGYLWGALGTTTKQIVRIDPANGDVTAINVPGVFPSTDTSGNYGAAWTYGNGNLGFANNESGVITQVAITNPGAATPTVTLVSRITGPSTSQNDATTTPALPADLALTVTPPVAAAHGGPIAWTVSVANVGTGISQGGSSGGTFSFPVPSGVTNVSVPSGCTLTAGTMQCVTPPLLKGGAPVEYEFTANAPLTVESSTTITLTGNEADPAPGNNTATVPVTLLPQARTSTGTGPAPQSASVAVPVGGSVTLVNGLGYPVTTIDRPGQGTYSVSGSSLVFTPVLGYTGTPAAAPFLVTGTAGTSTGTYTPTVTPPTPPVAPHLTTSDTSPAVQGVTVAPPAGGLIVLVDAAGDPLGGTSRTIPGQGTYVLTPASGVITFTPEPLYVGEATPLRFRLTDAYGQSATGSYTPTVHAPDGPSAVPLTSGGEGTETQEAEVVAPTGGTLVLLDDENNPQSSLVVPGVGTFTVAGAGLRFEPVLGYVGDGTSVSYRVTDAYGQTASSTYRPTVTVPPGPSAADLASSGFGTTPQSPPSAVTVPTQGSITLLDGDGQPATSVTVTAGTYSLDTETGEFTFTPVLGFTGSPAPAGYRVTDAYGQTADAIYTPTVHAPDGPTAVPLTSGGIGTETQEVELVAPIGGTLVLLDGANTPQSSLVVPGVGTFTVAGPGLRFEPVLGYVGDGASVSYRVTDAYGQTASSTYTPTVTVPPGPSAFNLSSTGTGTAPQSPLSAVTVPTQGSITLLDGDGQPATSVTIAAGTYTLDTETGEFTFTPVLGYAGSPTPVDYRITDAYGQTAEAIYAPQVLVPGAPTAVNLTSEDESPAVQHAAAVIPPSGTVTLLDADLDPASSVTVTGGTYTLDANTGVLSFTPEPFYVGSPTPVVYEVSDAYGTTARAQYSPTVLVPAGPVAVPFTSNGVGTEPQSPATTVVIPASGSVTLLGADGDPAASVTTAEGRFELDTTTGRFTFTPVLGFAGVASPVDYEVTDGYGQTARSSYTPTVLEPSVPVALPLTSTGVGVDPQSPSTFVTIPDGGSVTLHDGDGNPVASLSTPEGLFELDTATGELTFTPVLGFTGEAAPVTYEITDAYGQTATATYTPTVLAPAGPTASPITSVGPQGTAQRADVTLSIPTGGSVTLRDALGAPTLEVVVPGQGTYSLDPVTGVLSFLPLPDFVGNADPVQFAIIDAYGQEAVSTYTATVIPAAVDDDAPPVEDDDGTEDDGTDDGTDDDGTDDDGTDDDGTDDGTDDDGTEDDGAENDGTEDDEIAVTGASVQTALALALMLLLGGAVALVVARRWREN